MKNSPLRTQARKALQASGLYPKRGQAERSKRCRAEVTDKIIRNLQALKPYDLHAVLMLVSALKNDPRPNQMLVVYQHTHLNDTKESQP